MISPQVKNKLEYWKRRLVDLSRRNRLLYFTRQKGSTLFIDEPSPQQIFDNLVNERSWNIWLPPKSDDMFPDMYEELGYDESNKPHQDEIVTNIADRTRLERILLNLYRRSHTDYQECGVRILHVAFGLVNWRETKESEFISSPLLLVPVQLVRGDTHNRMTLMPTEEDITVNPALEIKLRTDFNIILPETPDNWENGNLELFIDSVRIVLNNDWNIEEKALIDLFSFHKLVIYKDLVDNAESISKNMIIKGLAREPDILIRHDGMPRENEVDTLHDPGKPFQILDADSSQQICIQSMLKGMSFVMQGPPGTGKSQTIANMISECIARGKTVLFVSEKMAALEAVYKRLVNKSLHDFCFELHSNKSNKRNVVKELDRCLTQYPMASGKMSKTDATTLIKRREDLHNYINALHKPRGTAGWTPYNILGKLALLHDIPVYTVGLANISDISDEFLIGLISIVGRIKHVWNIVDEGDSFPWLGYVKKTNGLRDRQILEQFLIDLSDITKQLDIQIELVANIFGLPKPKDSLECEWLFTACKLVDESPKPSRNWLTGGDLLGLKKDAFIYCESMQNYRKEKNDLQSLYGDAIFNISGDANNKVLSSLERLKELLHISASDSEAIFAERSLVENFSNDSSDLANNCIQDINELSEIFGCEVEYTTFGRIEDLAELAQLCNAEERPDPSWLSIDVIMQIKKDLPDLTIEIKKHNMLWQQIQNTYDESILDIDLDILIEKFSGYYSWPIRFLFPGYHSAKRTILKNSRIGSLSKTIANDLTIAREVLRQRKRIEPHFPELKNMLGFYYNAYSTDFDKIFRILDQSEQSLKLLGVREATLKAIALLSITEQGNRQLQDRGRRIKESLEQWSNILEYLPFRLPLVDLVDKNDVHIKQLSLVKLCGWAKEYGKCIQILNKITRDACSPEVEIHVSSFETLLVDIERTSVLRAIVTHIEQESVRLKEQYGTRFNGVDTDWDDILAALEWSWKVVKHFGLQPVSSDYIDQCINFDKSLFNINEYSDCFTIYKLLFAELCSMFGQDYPRKFNLEFFSDISEFVDILQRRFDDLTLWIDYQEIMQDAKDAGLYIFIDEAIKRCPPAELIEVILKKSVWSEWLDFIYKQDNILRHFRRERHEELINEFRSLDSQMINSATASIVSYAAERRPNSHSAAIEGSETSVIRREANKKSRHLPVRKLFGAIPNALNQLKPCLLMSPLSVSQFLDPEKHKFDVVIFDEASQICPWDAVGAIYRGSQLIVAGDHKQLPPTSFFERMALDDVENDVEDDSIADFESILDECRSIGLTEMMLHWHYRSRHENLIAFSNHWFYDNKLVTFPSMVDESDHMGVKFKYVEDGIYNRGKDNSKDNPIEAERVADLVYDHFSNRPNKTLGVVAFSQSQANAIEDAIEMRRRKSSEFDLFFKDDRLNGFFIKNLETVQGDERDGIIISVGYGRDVLGKISTNFGPLNRQGGERRLNVLVTRARDMVMVVSSIKAEDIDLKSTKAIGAVILHHYLDYAENGISVLQRSLTYSNGDVESPLEADVAAAIRSLGYECVHQVGCSSYRIDIGVIDPDKPGRYLLGVECDGAMYHSSCSARDRDRLRQYVLEDLGWTIYRIWSPDWVSRRDTELQRLQKAIEKAKLNFPIVINQMKYENEAKKKLISYISQDVPDDFDISCIQGCEPYYISKLPNKLWKTLDFSHNDNQKIIKQLVMNLVDAEGPIHIDHVAKRLSVEYGARSVSSKIRKVTQIIINDYHRDGYLGQEGDFIWPKRHLKMLVRIPTDDDATKRPIEWIYNEEIKTALCLIVNQCNAITEDALVRSCAKLYGFQRMTKTIDERLRIIIYQLLELDKIKIVGSSITLS